MPRSNQPEEGENVLFKDIINNNLNYKPLILDVGSGDGKWGNKIKEYFKIDGIEIWEENIKKYNLKDKYDNIFNEDIMNFDITPYKIIILGDVLEHLKKEQAIELINRFKHYQSIYLTIPISECTQDGNVYGNPYETHLYQWDHLELYNLGFRLLHVGVNANGKVIIGTYKMTMNNKIE